MTQRTAPKPKPPSKPNLGRNGRNLAKERKWEATRRRATPGLFLRPNADWSAWLARHSEPGETPGKTASRLFFSEIVRRAIDG